MVSGFRKRTRPIRNHLIWLLLFLLSASGFYFSALVSPARSSDWEIEYSLGTDGEFIIPEEAGKYSVYIEAGEQVSLKIQLDAKREQGKRRFQEVFSITMPELLYFDITDGATIPLEMLMTTEGAGADLTKCGYLLEELISDQANQATGSNATTSNAKPEIIIKASDNNANEQDSEMFQAQLCFVEELRDLSDYGDLELERAEIVLTFTSPFETGVTYTCIQNGNNCEINFAPEDTDILASSAMLRVEQIDEDGNSIIDDNAAFRLYYDKNCVKPYRDTANQGFGLVQVDFNPDKDEELEFYVEDGERVFVLYLQEKNPPIGYGQLEEVVRLEFREIGGTIYLTDATGQTGDVLFDDDNEAVVFIVKKRQAAVIELKAVKTMNHNPPDEFEFVLFLDRMPVGAVITGESGMEMELNEPISVCNDSEGNVDFGIFEFDTDGVYVFKAYTVNNGKKGIFYDPFVYCITVTVEGTVATAGYSQWVDEASSGLPERDSFYFANLFMPPIAPVFKRVIKGVRPAEQRFECKLQLVHAWPNSISNQQNQEITVWYGENILYQGGVGELLLEEGYEERRADEYPYVTVYSDLEGNIAFDDFTFSELGLYEFRLTEIEDEHPGIIYDKTAYYTGISLANQYESVSNHYSVAVNESYWYYDTDENKTPISQEDIVFKNQSCPTGTIQAQTILDNGFPKAGRFEFGLEFMKELGKHWTDARVLYQGQVLTDQMVTVKNVEAVNAGDINVLFDELEFSQFDPVNPVTYVFRLSQLAGDNYSIKYDETVYYVEITAKYDPLKEVYQLDYIYVTEGDYLRYQNNQTTYKELSMETLVPGENVIFKGVTLPLPLPETGGFGTRMFTLGGLMLICISFFMYRYLRKKRASK